MGIKNSGSVFYHLLYSIDRVVRTLLCMQACVHLSVCSVFKACVVL